MFSGTTEHTIDAKGRIILPQVFRNELGESFYITNGFDQCVQVMSEEKFNSILEQSSQMNGKAALVLQRIICGAAVKVTPNSQGRISIPQTLREKAKLDKNAIVVGMVSRIEIWNKDIYDEYAKENEDLLMDALDELKL